MLKTLQSLLIITASLGCGLTHAARPMMTDDARIVDPQSCQLESWVKSYQHHNEFWALPACNPLGFFELTAGGSKVTGEDRSTPSDRIIQAKTIFRELKPNDWGFGLAIGNSHHFSTTINRSNHDVYAYVPITWSFNDDAQLIHLNLGGARKELDHSFKRTWGLGSEFLVAPNTYFIAETFGEEALKPSYQAGLRHWLSPNKFQVDVTTGTKSSYNTQNRWFSLGIRLLFGN
jgi:hypothetical protein